MSFKEVLKILEKLRKLQVTKAIQLTSGKLQKHLKVSEIKQGSLENLIDIQKS